MLLICGILVPVVPLLWFFIKDFRILLLVEMFSGVAWAGFNLSSSNFIYDAINPEMRTKYIVYLNLLKGTSVFLGGTLGGVLSKSIGSLLFSSGILFLFLISGVLRFVVTLTFFNKLREMRLIEVPLGRSMFDDALMIVPTKNIYYNTEGGYIKKKKAAVVKEEPKQRKEPPKVDEEKEEGNK